MGRPRASRMRLDLGRARSWISSRTLPVRTEFHLCFLPALTRCFAHSPACSRANNKRQTSQQFTWPAARLMVGGGQARMRQRAPARPPGVAGSASRRPSSVAGGRSRDGVTWSVKLRQTRPEAHACLFTWPSSGRPKKTCISQFIAAREPKQQHLIRASTRMLQVNESSKHPLLSEHNRSRASSRPGNGTKFEPALDTKTSKSERGKMQTNFISKQTSPHQGARKPSWQFKQTVARLVRHKRGSRLPEMKFQATSLLIISLCHLASLCSANHHQQQQQQPPAPGKFTRLRVARAPLYCVTMATGCRLEARRLCWRWFARR